MKTIHYNVIYNFAVTSILLGMAAPALAGSVSGLTTFVPNTTAKASEVNGNFSAVQTAVNDNDSRITTLESNPSISGNITLPDSTDISTGNIIKNSIPFLHNYGTGNTFLGGGAGNFSLTGAYNTAEGASSLAYDTSGGNNTASGATSLYSNTTGNYNSAFGYSALQSNVGGSSNTAIGDASLQFNTSGNNNTAVGYKSLQANSAGASNTAVGWYSLYSNSGGGSNVAVGDYALEANTSGSNNIAIGPTAGDLLDTGSFNIDIGNEGNSAEANTIRIGNVNQTKTFIAGIYNTNQPAGLAIYIDSNGQLGTFSSSRRFKDHIHSMGNASDVLNQLHPVTFYYKTDHDPKGRHLQYGLVAEDVATIAPQLVAYGKDGKPDGVYYRFLAPMLLNQYQKQQQVIAGQKAQLKKQSVLLQKVAQLTKAQSREIVALKTEARYLRQQVKEVAVLKNQMARLNTIVAMRQGQEKLASATDNLQ